MTGGKSPSYISSLYTLNGCPTVFKGSQMINEHFPEFSADYNARKQTRPIVKHKHISPHPIVYFYITKAASERKLNMCN